MIWEILVNAAFGSGVFFVFRDGRSSLRFALRRRSAKHLQMDDSPGIKRVVYNKRG